MRVLLALVAAASLGCVAPRVDVDTSGLRPAAREASASYGGGSAPSSLTSAESQELKKDLARLERKVDDLNGAVKKLDERLKKVEKSSD